MTKVFIKEIESCADCPNRLVDTDIDDKPYCRAALEYNEVLSDIEDISIIQEWCPLPDKEECVMIGKHEVMMKTVDILNNELVEAGTVLSGAVDLNSFKFVYDGDDSMIMFRHHVLANKYTYDDNVSVHKWVKEVKEAFLEVLADYESVRNALMGETE